MRTNTIRLYTIMLITLLISIQSTAQQLEAYYPLRTEKQISNKIWFKHYGRDASGKGKHGAWQGDHWMLNWDGTTTIDNQYKLGGSSEVDKVQGWFPVNQTGAIVNTANTRYDYYPEGYEGYNGFGAYNTNSLYKATSDDVFLEIPDPYIDYHDFQSLRLPGAAITFWIYYDQDNFNSSTPIEVISVPWFNIEVSNQDLHVTNNSNTLYNSTVFNEGKGWYFAAVHMLPEASNQNVKFRFEYLKYDTSYTAATSNNTTIESSAILPFNKQTITKGKILSANFKGGLRDVSFYHLDMFGELTRKIRNENWLVSQKRNNSQSNSSYSKRTSYKNSLDGTVTDRFGNPNSATQNPNLNIGNALNGYDSKNGYTVSFWAKKTGGDNDFFTINNNGASLGGGAKKNTNDLGVYRYFPNDQTSNDFSPKPNTDGWFLSFWEPASLHHIPDGGWYHVILVVDDLQTYCFVGENQGLPSSQKLQWYLEFFGAYNQDITGADWTIGGSTNSNLIIDQFEVFNWPMSIFEAEALHIEELSNTNAPPENPMDIFLFIGQSNISGRSPATQSDLGIIDKTYLLNNSNSFEPAQLVANFNPPDGNPDNKYPGLNRYSRIKKVPQNIGIQRLNPAYGFAKSINQDATQINDIGIISNGRGNMGSEEFRKNFDIQNSIPCVKAPPHCITLYNESGGADPDSPNYYKKICPTCPTLSSDDPTKTCTTNNPTTWPSSKNAYNEALDILQAALDNYPNATLKGIVVGQGEKDFDQPAVWKSNWEQIIYNIRFDLSLPNLPFFFIGMGQWTSDNCIFSEGYDQSGGVGQHINGAIAELVFNSGLQDVYYVSTEGLTSYQGGTQVDKDVHFDRSSMLEIGERLACVYTTSSNGGTSCSGLGSSMASKNEQPLNVDEVLPIDEVSLPIDEASLPIDEVSVLSSLKVYPNPTTGNLTIVLKDDFASGEPIHMTIFDLSGRLIYNTVMPNSGLFEINLIESGVLNKGMYSLKLSSGSTERIHRIILQ